MYVHIHIYHRSVKAICLILTDYDEVSIDLSGPGDIRYIIFIRTKYLTSNLMYIFTSNTGCSRRLCDLLKILPINYKINP